MIRVFHLPFSLSFLFLVVMGAHAELLAVTGALAIGVSIGMEVILSFIGYGADTETTTHESI